jgi:uncharacterized protein (TIGR00290 family)
VFLAWSGGKDAAWALHVLRQDRNVEIAGLFTTIDEKSERVPIHEVPVRLLQAQADSIGVPLHRIPIPSPCTNAVYEQRLNDFLKGQSGLTHLAFGDLFLDDIRRYRERQFCGSGLELLFPLWGSRTDVLAREMTTRGLRAWITSVDTRQAPREWAGRMFDEAFVAEMPPGIDPCGENGEFHTFVFDGPMLGMRVEVRPGKKALSGPFMHCELERRG